MGFLIVFLGFFIILILSFIATIYIYIRFAFAVKSDTEVPAWIYKIGQSFKSRSYITFDNVTDSTAFKEATLFIVRLIRRIQVYKGTVCPCARNYFYSKNY